MFKVTSTETDMEDCQGRVNIVLSLRKCSLNVYSNIITCKALEKCTAQLCLKPVN